MPDTPVYAITYPCMGVPLTLADFSTFATDVEAALAIVDAEALAVTQIPHLKINGTVTTALSVEAVMLFTSTGATLYAVSGFTVNNAAGTITVITPGLYEITAQVDANQSTLTMTSQRAAIYINGVLHSARKYRAYNPVLAGALDGTYKVGVYLAAGDVVTLRYLWTGTGALLNPATGEIRMELLATP